MKQSKVTAQTTYFGSASGRTEMNNVRNDEMHEELCYAREKKGRTSCNKDRQICREGEKNAVNRAGNVATKVM